MPLRNVGTLTLDDLLLRTDVSPVELGLDIIQASLARDLQIHNQITTDMVRTFADVTTQRRRRYGVGGSIKFNKADEFTRMHTQKLKTGSVVEFPLDGFQAAVGWTAQFFAEATVADMAMTQQAIEVGHVQNIRLELQRAMYGATNFTFEDYRTPDAVTLNVKRFLNADGAPIPMGPNGEPFNASTHTHYLFSDGLTNAAAHALVDTVVEHHQNGKPCVFINSADQTAWEGLADFKPYVDQRLVLPADADTPIARLDPFRTNDKPIGIFGPAEVWLKPWALDDYAVCMDVAPSAPKPLVARVKSGNSIVLRTVAQNVLFPLQAEFMESEFGFGVWTRTNGAILYHGAGAVAYVEPTLV